MAIFEEPIGKYLKSTRHNLSLNLFEVENATDINQSIISRIENGKRTPTKEQLLKIGNLYNCNSEDLIANWISEKVANEIVESNLDEEVLEFIKAKVKIIKSKNTNKIYDIENRRYIGSKAKLTNWIIDIILNETKERSSIVDIFAGTATVAKAASKHFKKVIINDILNSNNVIYKAFFKKEEIDQQKINRIIEIYNKINPDELNENYFSINFGDKFFDAQNSKLIGYIREDIEHRKFELTDKEYSVLIATLIYNIDKIANTVGHFDAYIKKPIKFRKLILNPIGQNQIETLEIYQETANTLARKIKADVAYLDPPYNSRQYSRFYHIYETLVTWNKPLLYGTALKPEPENMSVYCTSKAKVAFKDLIENLDVKHIVVSYNNTYNSKSNSSENKIKLSEIKEILEGRGETKVFECSHKYFNTGKTEFSDHKELLFVTKVENGK